ncbi:MAG: SEC-C metal-binding domain-containing protein, partial [Alphaproteobacteria bacterium]
LASITYQNLFRMYPKLAGMTGTAMTEATEFAEIYKLEVVEIPTNVGVARKDEDDEVYRTMREKNAAIVALVEECRKRQQPVLVGTVSIEKSETLSAELEKKGIPHAVLNARFHEQEAQIISQAGKPGAVTIATNMAGRGTDIQLGGNLEMRVRHELADVADPAEREARISTIREEIAAAREVVLKAGGLYVVGTERHESRRIDNQLRGRSGRQGDPGGSKFFLSLEDDLMRIFGSQRMETMLVKLGLKEGEAIVHPWINKALEKAQQKVEARNFEIRKQLLRFDDVMNDQRKVIYEQRRDLMRAEDVAERVAEYRHETVAEMIERCIPENAYAEQWDTATLQEGIQRLFGLELPVAEWAKEEGIAEEEIRTRVTDAVDRHMAEKTANIGVELMRMAEKSILLQVLDQHWKEHLLNLDHLRQGIHLRGYAQRDPLNEYKKEAFELFEGMLGQVRESTTQILARLQVRSEEPVDPLLQEPPAPDFSRLRETNADPALAGDEEPDAEAQPRQRAGAAADPRDPSTWGKVARNASCPCGSGRKYKHCHGRV